MCGLLKRDTSISGNLPTPVAGLDVVNAATAPNLRALLFQGQVGETEEVTSKLCPTCIGCGVDIFAPLVVTVAGAVVSSCDVVSSGSVAVFASVMRRSSENVGIIVVVIIVGVSETAKQ